MCIEVIVASVIRRHILSTKVRLSVSQLMVASIVKTTSFGPPRFGFEVVF